MNNLRNTPDTNMIHKLELNRTLTHYSAHADEQLAYEAMQQAGFKVASMLMQQPRGSMADDIQGHAYWVSPLDGMADIFCTPDYEPLATDSNVFAVSDFEGQSASDLDETRIAMEQWLHSPKFIQRDAMFLDALVSGKYGPAATTAI